jgi:3-oxoacyl-[acyl-carrier-protein] synthase II
MTDESVWITGVGAASPIGCDLETIEANLLAGRSGITAITRFPTDDHPSQIAGQIEQVPCPPERDPAQFRAKPALEQAATWCAEAALRDAGWWEHRQGARIGLILGLGAEWMLLWEADHAQGGSLIHEPWRDNLSTLERVRLDLGLRGPSLALSAACASGNHALEIGRQWLRLGLVDVCVAGACDMAVTPVGMATFGNLRALSRRNDEPSAASRPFDRSRDGFVMGEGGAVFVLERARDASRRSAKVYAHVAGCGSSSDAYHHVIPSPEPTQAIAAVQQALRDAKVAAADIDYINAHATSTPVGDAAEAAVLQAVLGPAVNRVPVSSTKSMTGHLLTAAGAIEALACLAAIRHEAIPPTINLSDPDVVLCLVAREARPQPVRVAMSNSFGFGGSNTCLVLCAV